MKTILCCIIFSISVSVNYGQANTTLSNLASPTSVNQDLLPNGNKTRNLGSTSKSWKILYVDSSIFLKDVLFIKNTGTQNAFIGEGSGNAITTGKNNAAFGYHALYGNKTNSSNTAFGSLALFKNKADNNTAIGYQALYSNTTATLNTAIGYQALFSNTTGSPNTAVGWGALYSNTTGSENTAVGQSVLYQNTVGYCNIALGRGALFSNTEGANNTASGFKALFFNITGNNNTAFGSGALLGNIKGENNVAIGFQALYANVSDYNVAIGSQALHSNIYGTQNVAIGLQALRDNTDGINNVAIGFGASGSNHEGSQNTVIGAYSGSSGNSNNTIIGSISSIDGDYSTVIGFNAYTNTSNLALLGNTSTAFCGGYANWTNYASDKRLKTHVTENVKGLEFIKRLRPITYHLDLMSLYKIQGISPYGKQEDKMTAAMKADMDKNIQRKEAVLMSGFIAQEVEQAAKESDYDFDGIKKPQNDKDNYGLSYATFVVPLVKAVQELDVKTREIDTLKTQVRQQRQEINEFKNEVKELKQLVQGFIQTKLLTTSESYLSQTIPNPTSGNTIIPFQIEKGSHSAVIKITQTGSGKLIKSIAVDVNATQILFNTNTLPSGNYMYSLIVDGKVADTKQMILSR